MASSDTSPVVKNHSIPEVRTDSYSDPGDVIANSLDRFNAAASLPYQRPGVFPRQHVRRSVSPAAGPSSRLISVPISTDEGRLSVAIDFGATYSGVAYVSPRIAAGNVQQILHWPGTFETYRKVPTCLLYDEESRVLAWGIEAKNVGQGCFKCEWFKLFLDPHALRSGAAVDPRLPPLPPGKDPVQVITDFLSCLWEYAKEQITREVGAIVDPDSADMWLTVPATWNCQGCELMRKAAIDAGLVHPTRASDHAWRERLRIITEPEAAAVHCALLSGLHDLKPSQTFMICDAGGGTVDLAGYKVTGEIANLELAQISVFSGENCGSVFLDLRFRELVKTLLFEHPVHLDVGSMAFFLHAFSETEKLSFRGARDDEVMFNFNCFAAEDHDDPSVGLMNGELCIPGCLLRREVFDPIVLTVLELIEKQIAKMDQHVDTLFLVGGFSGNEYLFQSVKERFSSSVTAITRPSDADTATLRGAAKYGVAHRLSVSSAGGPHGYDIEPVGFLTDARHHVDRPTHNAVYNMGVFGPYRSFLNSSLNARDSGESLQPTSSHIVPVAQGSLSVRESDTSSSGGEEAPSIVTWWSTFNMRPHVTRSGIRRSDRGLSEEQISRIADARKRVVHAACSVIGTAGKIAHKALTVGVDLLDFAPIPGLAPAGHILLDIWDAFEQVQSNRSSCLRLTERCANILTSVREEVVSTGSATNEELKAPVDKLHESLTEVLMFLRKQMDMPLLKRFLRRDKVLDDIAQCDKNLTEALGMLGLSIQIRTLKLVQASQHNGATFFGRRPSKKKVQENLEEIQMEQDKKDRMQDVAELRRLLQAAVQTNDDAEMIEILQVGRDEMPEAMRALEHTLKDYVSEHGQSGSRNPKDVRKRDVLLARIRVGRSKSQVDPNIDLDRQFMESGIESLRRLTLSQGNQPHLPSWTITRYEIDVDQMIGVGFFSNVYKGTWRNRTVAIKMLAEATPKELFLHEANLWKTLSHPNILQLLGASSASSDPPWFLVSPYYKNGNLVKYLKGLPALNDVHALQIMYEIASGMSYLHQCQILHGDLKAVNILVDDNLRCVITDFGQSELKSEVYRLSRMPVSRGTLRWQAPEILNGINAMTQQIDVYAFAITCAEVLTKGSLPWPLLDDAGVRHKVLVERGCPPLPSDNLATDTRLRGILDACWSHDASYRPPFSQISTDINNLRLRLTRNSV